MGIPVDKFIKNINTIYKKKPKYQLGSDSFTECDCIGMPRRAAKMEGLSPSGMSGTNYASRYTLKDFTPITSVSQLKLGEAVVKGRPYDPKDKYPLPSKYLKGGSSYNGDTTNYVHIGTVTNVNPLEITHMTSPTAKKDTKLGKWNYRGKYPFVDYEKKVVITLETAKVIGGTLNMRKEKNTNSLRITAIPSGAMVAVTEKGNEWCKVAYNENTGYVMTKFLSFESEESEKITLVLERTTAKALYEALKLSLNL